MRLGLRVFDEGCEPVPGAAVEVWHCDASGDYSTSTGPGTLALLNLGVQPTASG